MRSSVIVAVIFMATTMTGCATARVFVADQSYEVRESRRSEIEALIGAAQKHPYYGCRKALPEAIAHGDFSEIFANELQALRAALDEVCRCRDELTSRSGPQRLVQLNELPGMSMPQLLEVLASVFQPEGVALEAERLLRERLSTASLKDLDHLTNPKRNDRGLYRPLKQQCAYSPVGHTFSTYLDGSDLAKVIDERREAIAAEAERRAIADAEARRARDIEELTKRVENALADNDPESALKTVADAEKLMGTTLPHLRATIAQSEMALARLALAWKYAKADKPDEAWEELEEARALGADDPKLPEAIDRTPTARKRAAKAKREERVAKGRARRSVALRKLCYLFAEQTRASQRINMARAGDCGGSPMSSAAGMHCINAYGAEQMNLDVEYERVMRPLRARARKDVGRDLNTADCCEALPSVYQWVEGHCWQAR